jgi:hypothetical protein
MIRITEKNSLRTATRLIADGRIEGSTTDAPVTDGPSFVTILRPGDYIAADIIAQTPFGGTLEISYEAAA